MSTEEPAARRERAGTCRAVASRRMTSIARPAGAARPIVVLGCPRSGTTLLQVALHSHPRIAVPPETWLLVDAYRERLTFGDLADPAARERLADWVLARRKVRDLGVPKKELRARIRTAPPTLGSALAAVLQAYADRFDKPRWGDKRPGYYRDVAAVRRLLPDAQFVHVVRDARACVASLKTVPWWRQGTPAAVATWMEAQSAGDRWRARLGPGSWHELRYEELVRDPEPVLRALCTFLGEEYDPAMTEPAAAARIAVPTRKTWHERTTQGIDPGRVSAYRDVLTAQELALVERVAGRRLATLGHDLHGGERVEPALLASYLRTAAHRRLAQSKQHALDVLRDRRAGTPVAAVARA